MSRRPLKIHYYKWRFQYTRKVPRPLGPAIVFPGRANPGRVSDRHVFIIIIVDCIRTHNESSFKRRRQRHHTTAVEFRNLCRCPFGPYSAGTDNTTEPTPLWRDHFYLSSQINGFFFFPFHGLIVFSNLLETITIMEIVILCTNISLRGNRLPATQQYIIYSWSIIYDPVDKSYITIHCPNLFGRRFNNEIFFFLSDSRPPTHIFSRKIDIAHTCS